MIEIMQQMAAIIRAHHVSTFFVNGAPGSGKSHFLALMADELPAVIMKSNSFGPYKITEIADGDLCKTILDDIAGAGFVSSGSPVPEFDDITNLLSGLKKYVDLRLPQYFLFFLDIQDAHKIPINILGDFFSRLRRLEGSWNEGNYRLFILTTGFWDPSAIKSYFESIHTSLPYTTEKNYLEFHGINIEQTQALVRRYDANARDILGDILWELSDGHPALVLVILQQLEGKQITVGQILEASRKVAETSPFVQRLMEAWKDLPGESKAILDCLLDQKFIRAPIPLPPYLERLRVFGLIKHMDHDHPNILTLRSWMVRLILHYHAFELGIRSNPKDTLDVQELIPEVSSICIEGYKVINQIENMVRNFVVAQLWKGYVSGAPHPLSDRVFRNDGIHKSEMDAYTRAMDWQDKNEDKGVHSITINPVIAYLSTKDLISLVKEIAQEINSENWKNIAQSLDNLSGIRDAVMHNQLIDEDDLGQLYILHDLIIQANT
jgi:hypothetical protein